MMNQHKSDPLKWPELFLFVCCCLVILCARDLAKEGSIWKFSQSATFQFMQKDHFRTLLRSQLTEPGHVQKFSARVQMDVDQSMILS